MRPQLIVVWTGAGLVIVGVALIALQMWRMPDEPVLRGLRLDALGAKVDLTTTYVGLVIVIVGAILEVIGLYALKGMK
jgi:hypothetical protein